MSEKRIQEIIDEMKAADDRWFLKIYPRISFGVFLLGATLSLISAPFLDISFIPMRYEGEIFVVGLLLALVPAVWTTTTATIRLNARLRAALLVAPLFVPLSKKAFWVLRRNIESHFELIAVGTLDRHLRSEAATARFVNNTFVKLPDDGGGSFDPREIYQKFFDSDTDGVWTDVIGPREIVATRYQNIETNGNVLRINVLKHNSPVLNFILFEEQEGMDEGASVVFGWTGAQTDKFYRSSNPDVLGRFRNYLKHLQAYRWAEPTDGGMEYDYHISRGTGPNGLVGEISQSGHVPKDGWWFTRYKPFSAEHSEADYTLFGFIKPSFAPNNDAMRVIILDAEFNLHEETTHSEYSTFGRNEILYKFRHPNTGDRGSVFYRFSHHGPRRLLSGWVVSEETGEYGILQGIVLPDENLTDLLGNYSSLNADERSRIHLSAKRFATEVDAAFSN